MGFVGFEWYLLVFYGAFVLVIQLDYGEFR